MTVDNFDFDYDFDSSATLTYEHKIHPLANGDRYQNAIHAQPLLSFQIKATIYDETTFTYLTDFFNSVNGSEQTFAFRDITDFEATENNFDTGRGIKTIGVLVPSGNDWQLCKRYILEDNAYVDRPITRPNDDVTIFNDQGDPVGFGLFAGGSVPNGIGGANYTWSGTFFVPVRLENDRLPQAKTVFNTALGVWDYELPDLNLIEVFEFSPELTHNIILVNNHYYNLSPEYGNTYERVGQTAIVTNQSKFEYRKSIAERLEMSISHNRLEQEEMTYVLGLYRVLLGGFCSFRFRDLESNIDSAFSFTDPLIITTIVQDGNTNTKLYEIGTLNAIEEINPIKTGYARLWKITKVNNTTLGVTEHDADLFYNGDRYQASHSITGSSNPSNSELETDTTDLEGVSSTFAIDSDELYGNQLRNAVLEIFQYDWINKTIVKQIFRGNLGEWEANFIDNEMFDYKIQALSLRNKLKSSDSIKTSESCRFEFLSQGAEGKACNRTIDSSVRITATVTASTVGSITIDGTVNSNYEKGTIKPLGGYAVNQVAIISTVPSANTVNLLIPYPFSIEVGTQVELTVYCNKSVNACLGFNNLPRFGGHPELLGRDKSIASPN